MEMEGRSEAGVWGGLSKKSTSIENVVWRKRWATCIVRRAIVQMRRTRILIREIKGKECRARMARTDIKEGQVMGKWREWYESVVEEVT